MGALSWQLRATMSLVRPCERQGEGYAAELAEARACLGDIYATLVSPAAFLARLVFWLHEDGQVNPDRPGEWV